MYLRPAETSIHEFEEKKSRFIGYLEPCDSRQHMQDLLASLRNKYPDARHFSYAFILGDPHSPKAIASDDDGEPSGTAGKPILNVLQHRNLGDALMVVVRYFGGIKLGAGGLVRAYSAVTSQAVQQARTLEMSAQCIVEFLVDYSLDSKVRHYAAQMQYEVVQAQYLQRVAFILRIPAVETEVLKRWLLGVTSGEAQLTVRADEGLKTKTTGHTIDP